MKRPSDSMLKPVIFVVICTFLTASAQVLWKYGAGNITNIDNIIYNVPLLLGFILYALGALLLVIALKYGNLSLIYPFIALSFIWVTLASAYLFNEGVHLFNWLGIIAILGGVSLVGYGSSR